MQDGPHPGSARTRVQIVNADTTAIHASPIEQTGPTLAGEAQHGSRSGAVITVNPPMASPDAGMPKRSFTGDDRLELLFDPGLIPASMRDGLQEDYHVCQALLVRDVADQSGKATSFRRSATRSFRSIVNVDYLARCRAFALLFSIRLPQIRPGDILRGGLRAQAVRRTCSCCDIVR